MAMERIILLVEQAPVGYMEVLILIFVGIVFVAGIVLTIVLIRFFRKRNNEKSVNKNIAAAIIPRPTGHIKRCPTCQSTYTDESLNYCLSDGAILERTDEVETVVFQSK